MFAYRWPRKHILIDAQFFLLAWPLSFSRQFTSFVAPCSGPSSRKRSFLLCAYRPETKGSALLYKVFRHRRPRWYQAPFLEPVAMSEWSSCSVAIPAVRSMRTPIPRFANLRPHSVRLQPRKTQHRTDSGTDTHLQLQMIPTLSPPMLPITLWTEAASFASIIFATVPEPFGDASLFVD